MRWPMIRRSHSATADVMCARSVPVGDTVLTSGSRMRRPQPSRSARRRRPEKSWTDLLSRSSFATTSATAWPSAIATCAWARPGRIKGFARRHVFEDGEEFPASPLALALDCRALSFEAGAADPLFLSGHADVAGDRDAAGQFSGLS